MRKRNWREYKIGSKGKSHFSYRSKNHEDSRSQGSKKKKRPPFRVLRSTDLDPPDGQNSLQNALSNARRVFSFFL